MALPIFVGASPVGAVRDELVMATKAEWPACDQYVEDTIREVKEHFKQQFDSWQLKKLATEGPDGTAFPDKVIGVLDLHQENLWLDNKLQHDFRRMRRLIAELRHRGFRCSVQDNLGWKIKRQANGVWVDIPVSSDYIHVAKFHGITKVTLSVGLGFNNFVSALQHNYVHNVGVHAV